MERKFNFDANEYLKQKIKSLDKFSYLCGTEGRAYFVDDSFVVKTYLEPFDDYFLFNEYCKELRSFGEKGYAVPKFYAWQCAPCKGGNTFMVYILQERIKGKALFDLDEKWIYESCKKFCTKKDFDYALAEQNNNPELLGLIIREHILEFLSINKALNLFSESNLENFISSDYGMRVESRFSSPDVQSANVIFDGSKLTIVDNAFLGYDRNDVEYIGMDALFGYESKSEKAKIDLLKDMFMLFYYNENINWLPKFRCGSLEEIKKLKNENQEACFYAMRRFVKKVNEMYSPIISDVYDYEVCRMVAKDIFKKEMADEICAEIQKSF